MELSGHTVLVTGGSAGIGIALAREFYKRNNRVIICGRSLERLTRTKEEMSEIETVQCDLAQDSDIRNLAEVINTKFPNLSILVNNAGVQLNYKFTEIDTEKALKDIDWESQVNFNGMVKLITLCLPLLRQKSESAIINVSSGLALTPKTSAPIYCATKAAVHSFSQSLRYQMEDNAPNVAVFEAILPMVATDMTRGRGKGKISPQQVADEVFKALSKNDYEIRVGKVKLLVWINRFAPWLAQRILRGS
ncbi:MAG: SDR family NAD(P)-dependent oxidoreductase [Xenococcaceae cyanobacterium MO_234.B1]|nr:SDR family NAD(P)-dependent oxidoreductase [Xenococcaceae cyanobacterium MO_234.B1]